MAASEGGGGYQCSDRDLFACAMCMNVCLVGLFPNTFNSDSAKINLLLDSSLNGDGRRRWVKDLLLLRNN